MSDNRILTVVYTPPKQGMPYLAVVIMPDGDVTATSHATAIEAQAAVDAYAQGLAKAASGDA